MLKNDVLSTDKPESAASSISSAVKPEKESAQDGKVMVDILAQMEKNEQTNREILKAVKFIKSHYFWRWIFNITKVIVLIMIIVLGIVSWDSIVELIRATIESYISNMAASQ